jgi:hypothetical protein
MATYVRAGLLEVAAALSALTGELHPVAVGTAPKRLVSVRNQPSLEARPRDWHLLRATAGMTNFL